MLVELREVLFKVKEQRLHWSLVWAESGLLGLRPPAGTWWAGPVWALAGGGVLRQTVEGTQLKSLFPPSPLQPLNDPPVQLTQILCPGMQILLHSNDTVTSYRLKVASMLVTD